MVSYTCIESDAVLHAGVYRYVEQMKYTHVDFSQNRQKTPVNDTFEAPIAIDKEFFSVGVQSMQAPSFHTEVVLMVNQ